MYMIACKFNVVKMNPKCVRNPAIFLTRSRTTSAKIPYTLRRIPGSAQTRRVVIVINALLRLGSILNQWGKGGKKLSNWNLLCTREPYIYVCVYLKKKLWSWTPKPIGNTKNLQKPSGTVKEIFYGFVLGTQICFGVGGSKICRIFYLKIKKYETKCTSTTRG